MLKRDLLITLHLRVRIFATPSLKDKVRVRRELALARRGRIRSHSVSLAGHAAPESPDDTRKKERRDSESRGSDAADSSPVDYWMSMSPKHARAQARKMSPAVRNVKRDRSLSLVYNASEASEKDGGEEDEDYDAFFDEDVDLPISVGADVRHWEDITGATVILPDPGRANAAERLWLSAMSDGKTPYIARRFEQYVVSLNSGGCELVSNSPRQDQSIL